MSIKPTILIASTTFNIDISELRSDFNFIYNETGYRLNQKNINNYLYNVSGVVADLEPYTKETLERHRSTLKVISRIGSGLDTIDMNAADNNKIKILSTPHTPVKAVVELTIGMMINLCRSIHIQNNDLHNNMWLPRIGSLLSERKIGILGKGRIGTAVYNALQYFTDSIKYHDIISSRSNCDINELFSTCDLITVHIPLEDNINFVNKNLIDTMPQKSFLINNSRGRIVNDIDVASALDRGILSGYAADTHTVEPYHGILQNKQNTILTPHIGSHTTQTRYEMNINALNNCVNFLKTI